jgi:hypothetical protein
MKEVATIISLQRPPRTQIRTVLRPKEVLVAVPEAVVRAAVDEDIKAWRCSLSSYAFSIFPSYASLGVIK